MGMIIRSRLIINLCIFRILSKRSQSLQRIHRRRGRVTNPSGERGFLCWGQAHSDPGMVRSQFRTEPAIRRRLFFRSAAMQNASPDQAQELLQRSRPSGIPTGETPALSRSGMKPSPIRGRIFRNLSILLRAGSGKFSWERKPRYRSGQAGKEITLPSTRCRPLCKECRVPTPCP